jgi:predicted phosphodiesterase
MGGTPQLKAVLSDIHGNLEALQAVLEDAARQEADAVYCLGDIVGYGPDTRECVDLAMRWPVVLRGNFEQALLGDPASLGPTAVIAGRSLAWSLAGLAAPLPSREAAEQRRRFLSGLPRSRQEGDFVFVHASPRDPLYEYLFPEDICNRRKMERAFAAVGRYAVHGHTHLPGVITDDFRFVAPADVGHAYRLDGRKTLVDVGSVGQPRDGDWRACYALLDGETIRWRRVVYDIEATVRKIRDTDGLDDFLGDRLRMGR